MTSPAVRHITTASVVVVAGIAAAVSFSHMQQLADHAGEGWRSWLIPVSIDGLVVAASMVLLTRRRAGLPGGWLAWGALAAGVLASLAANMADARPELTAVLIAGWPAAAFAVAFELLLQQRRAEQTAGETPAAPAPAPAAPAAPAPASLEIFDLESVVGELANHPTNRTGLAVQTEPARPVCPSSPGPPAPTPAVRQESPALTPAPPPEPASVIASLAEVVRPLVAEGHGRGEIAKRLGISEHQARQAIGKANAKRRPALRAVASEKR